MTNSRISIETLAIGLLIVISVMLRVLSLGEVPLTSEETAPALAAWRAASVESAGEFSSPESPAVFWSQSVMFTLMGANETSARLITAFAGVILSLTPLLFRDLLGRGRAYIITLVFVFSPILLATSRFSDGMTWASLFAMLGLWAVWRWWETGKHGIFAVVMFALLALFADPGGLMLALILLAAGGIALSLSSLEFETETDQLRTRLREFPWALSGVAALLVIFALSTAFFMYPNGLSLISANIEGFLRGWSEGNTRSFFPLGAATFYETALFIMGIISLVLLNIQQRVTFIERFLIAWLGLGLLVSIIYPGGGAADALWIILPLAGLASYSVNVAFEDYRLPLMWMANWEEDGEIQMENAQWGRWLMAVVMFILMFVLALHFQIAVRGILLVEDGSLNNFLSSLSAPGRGNVSIGLIWMLIAILMMLVGYFLSSSVWGSVIPAQGYLIGFFLFALVAHLGTGWNLIGTRVESATEFWYATAPTEGADLLRMTLEELAFRETEGMNALPISVYADENSLAAWVVRDFNQVSFIQSVEEAELAEVIIMPKSALQVLGEPALRQPELGTDYVGQSFTLNRTWSISTLRGLDWLPWWAVRDVRVPQWDNDTYILWVREDIYNSSPFLLDQP